MKIAYYAAFITLLSTASAWADPASTPPPTPLLQQACTTLREAYAFVSITKIYWTQESGIWVQKKALLANTQTEVPVFKESSAGCTTPKVLELDNLLINGTLQTVRVYSYIAIEDASLHPSPNKVFTANYWLSSDGGHSAYASAWTPDMTTQKMGVSFNREHAASSAHADNIDVAIYFDDNNTSK